MMNKQFLVVITVVAVLIGGGYAFKTRSLATSGDITSDLAVLPVSTLKIKGMKSYVIKGQFPGQVTPYRESDQGFDRPGIIAKIYVDEGDAVTKGQILAELDSRQLTAKLAGAKADLAVAEASKNEAVARLNMVKNNFERSKQLLEKGHISQQRFDMADFEIKGAEAQSLAAEAAVIKAKSAISLVQADLGLVKIRAPFAGVITKKYADEGSSLGAARPVVHIIEDRKLVINVGVPEGLVKHLKIGHIYDLSKQNSGVLKSGISVKLRSIVNMVDTKTRTVTAVFDVLDSKKVRAGELMYLALDHEIMGQGFWVPTTSLGESRRGLWSLYAVVQDGSGGHKISRREVQLIHTGQDKVFVRGTLKEGDDIVRAGIHRLVPSQRVRIVPSS